ncbi:MAG: flagellar biosynthetic protein FliP, partial [Bdellovibrionales bacterium]|nr:flagellar biosynthetic protein FliP [Bdellovibrionales bacterium]
MDRRLGAITAIAAVSALVLPGAALAQSVAPSITINTTGGGEVMNTEVFTGLKLALLFTAMTFLPALVMTTTSFTRIVIILSLTRQALGTAQTPPNQVILGLGLFLTLAIMGPTFSKIYDESLVPYSEDQISHEEAFKRAFSPLRTFMLRHTRERDLELF